ncbi:MAG: 30S ribosomal protein S12 methylthiotransferase RimO, partial [Candidatus Dadabacteria bacterium]
MARIYFIGLGCAKNEVDGQVLLGLAAARGHRIVSTVEEADTIVVNTCAFIEQAREESIEAILEVARNKGRERRLVVTGCLAQRYGRELLEELPEVDAVLGSGMLERVDSVLESNERSALVGPPHLLADANTPRWMPEHAGWAYLKISDGCDHECSFCSIPSFRGPHRSRPPEDVVAEAERLAAAGVVELNLVGQDVSAYGRDRGRRGELGELLERLARVPGIERIRCLYLYPNTLDRSVLGAMAACDKVCPYIDIPLQHADAGVLRAMRRGGDARTLLRLIEEIRQAIPDAAIRSTFIVGFPGETDEAFARLCEFVRRARFDRIAVFEFSPEAGTAAARLGGRVPRALKRRRRDELLALQEEVSAERLA